MADYKLLQMEAQQRQEFTTKAHRQLWSAVLLRAIHDALNPPLDIEDQVGAEWFSSKPCEVICEMLGIDQSALAAYIRANKVADRDLQWNGDKFAEEIFINNERYLSTRTACEVAGYMMGDTLAKRAAKLGIEPIRLKRRNYYRYSDIKTIRMRSSNAKSKKQLLS